MFKSARLSASTTTPGTSAHRRPTPAGYAWTIEALPPLGITYFLHNNPTPATGDTSSKADLSMDTTAPTATSLFNFDWNRDSAPGRLIQKGGSGANETDLGKYQTWRTAPFATSRTFNGPIKITFWSGMKDFRKGRGGSVHVFIRVQDGDTYADVGNGALAERNWQGGSNTWVSETLTISNCPSFTVGVNQRLEVKFIVAGSAGDDMWFAYDTSALPTKVEFP